MAAMKTMTVDQSRVQPNIEDHLRTAGSSRKASTDASTSIFSRCERRSPTNQIALTTSINATSFVITLDKEGAYLRTATTAQHVKTLPRIVYDVTGAGDMMLAMLAVAMAAGCDEETALQLANIASGIEAEKVFVATGWGDEIVNEIISTHKGKT